MDLYSDRVAPKITELHELFSLLYGEEAFPSLLSMLEQMAAQRPERMRLLDATRIKDPFWYQHPAMIGMMLYVDNFAENFTNMLTKIDYLKDLGITYLHIMPVCTMPELLNDGGYAVSDFTSIDPRFGTNEDFDRFTQACHEENISICLDFVLNHTSDEHPWALEAIKGDKEAQNRYFFFPDRTLPDAYEETVNEVFPLLAPGNFTYYAHMDRWVLTTFNHYQWDLNYQNPHVCIDMARYMLVMANRGVDIFRFDAIPYIWKTWGTSCRNLPQVHIVLRIFRLILEIVAPATIIKGEVVMAPQQVAPYFGTEEAPECHLLYNVSLMVELWNTLATRDTRMLSSLIAHIPKDIPLGASWVNYARCHDDIGWGFDEEAARNCGFDPFLHKRFLIEFYQGIVPGSFSRGELYEADPKTLDARNCGTCASLCGLERALSDRDEYQMELAIKRIVLLHAFCMALSGLPVIYSGDEIARLNDYSYIHDPKKSHDSRFLHRGSMDWTTVVLLSDLRLPAAKVYYYLRRFIAVKRERTLMGGSNTISVIPTSDKGVICLFITPRNRHSEQQVLIVLANFSEFQTSCYIEKENLEQVQSEGWADIVQGKRVVFGENQIILGPYEMLLLTRIDCYGR